MVFCYSTDATRYSKNGILHASNCSGHSSMMTGRKRAAPRRQTNTEYNATSYTCSVPFYYVFYYKLLSMRMHYCPFLSCTFLLLPHLIPLIFFKISIFRTENNQTNKPKTHPKAKKPIWKKKPLQIHWHHWPYMSGPSIIFIASVKLLVWTECKFCSSRRGVWAGVCIADI